MHYRSGAGRFYQSTPTSRPFTVPFSPICPIKSYSPPRSHHRASSIGDMVGATRSRRYTPDSTTGVEASRRQGRPLVPAYPTAADIVVAPPLVEHHYTHQRRDRRGRFSRTSNVHPRRRTMMNWSSGAARRNPRCDASCLHGTRRPRAASTSSC